MKRLYSVNLITLIAFVSYLLGPLPFAEAQKAVLPNTPQLLHLSTKFTPPEIRGMKVFSENPFHFDFILEKGDSKFSDAELVIESKKLVRYFLASLTIPEKDLWVNLSPYEKDRIVPEAFGVTDMGRDLLTQDYLLKQITASLLYPEDEIGAKFWKRMKELAKEKFGTDNLEANTFNKVWVVPEKAVVYENAKAGTAYIVESHLKVMLDEDFLALSKNTGINAHTSDTNKVSSQIVREIIIPELTKEINENQHFAKLRQIYTAYILAIWYKQKIKNSILNQVYADKNKVAGVNIDDLDEKQKIYAQYLEAFKKGAYNYIKEDYDATTDEMIPRKYFSGGFRLSNVNTYIDAEPTRTTSSAAVLDINLTPVNPSDVSSVLDQMQKSLNPQLAATPVTEPTKAEIDLGMKQLGLTAEQAHDILIDFTKRKDDFTRILNDPSVTLTMVANSDPHGGHETTGVTFLYTIGGTADKEGQLFWRFKINRKPDSSYDDPGTLIFSGLVNRDLSRPGAKARMILPYLNFDYPDLSEPLLGFKEFKDFISTLVPEGTMQNWSREDFGSAKYRKLLEDFYSPERYERVVQKAKASGKTFNDVLNWELGGADYAGVELYEKILGFAAVGITDDQLIAHFKNRVKDANDLSDILINVDILEHPHSPSQQYPSNDLLTQSFIDGSAYLRSKAHEWRMTIELEVAMPDGLQNWVIYQRILGYRLVNPTPYTQKLLDDFKSMSKKDGTPIQRAWKLLKIYHFKHELAVMIDEPGPTEEQIALAGGQLGLNEEQARTLLEEFKARKNTFPTGKKVDFKVIANDGILGAEQTKGITLIYSVGGTKDKPGAVVGQLKINRKFGSNKLTFSGLTTRDLNQPDGEEVLVFLNSDKRDVQKVQSDYARLENFIAEQLPAETVQGLAQQWAGVDFSDQKYSKILFDLFGIKHEEIAAKKEAQGKTFNEVLDKQIGNDEYPGLQLYQKVLVRSARGLRKTQIARLFSPPAKEPIYGFDEKRIKDPNDFLDVISSFSVRFSKYSPTQQFPPSMAILLSLLNGTTQIAEEHATSWGMGVEFDFAIGQEVQNVIWSTLVGYRPSANTKSDILDLLRYAQTIDDYRVDWDILRDDRVQGERVTMEYVGASEQSSEGPSRIKDKIILSDLSLMLENIRDQLQLTLDQPITLNVASGTRSHGYIVPGVRITFMSFEDISLWSWRLNFTGEDLIFSTTYLDEDPAQSIKVLSPEKFPANLDNTMLVKNTAQDLQRLAKKWGYQRVILDVSSREDAKYLEIYEKELGFTPSDTRVYEDLKEAIAEIEKRELDEGPSGLYDEFAFTQHPLTMTWEIEKPASQTNVSPETNAKQAEAASSSAEKVGGINFDPELLMLQTQNSNGEIIFTVDPLVLQELTDAPGFNAIINNIKPLQNLQVFLNVNAAAN